MILRTTTTTRTCGSDGLLQIETRRRTLVILDLALNDVPVPELGHSFLMTMLSLLFLAPTITASCRFIGR